MRFNNILLVVDPSTNNDIAFRRAFKLAKREEARLTVCEVVDWNTLDYSQYKLTPLMREQKTLNSAIADLKSWVSTQAETDLDIDFQVTMGSPVDEIPLLVAENQYDLVIKSVVDLAERRSRANKRDDITLMRRCPCPLWLVKEQDQAEDGVVMAALDIAPGDTSLSGLNQRILDAARSVALAESRPLYLVHSWQLRGEGLLRSRASEATHVFVDEMAAQEEFRRTEWLRRAIDEAEVKPCELNNDVLEPHLSLVKGLPNRVLPEQAEQLAAHLVVMGSAARRGLSGFVTPNTSEQILPRLRSSMLLVKPGEDRIQERVFTPNNVTTMPRRSSIRHRDRLSRQYTKGAI